MSLGGETRLKMCCEEEGSREALAENHVRAWVRKFFFPNPYHTLAIHFQKSFFALARETLKKTFFSFFFLLNAFISAARFNRHKCGDFLSCELCAWLRGRLILVLRVPSPVHESRLLYGSKTVCQQRFVPGAAETRAHRSVDAEQKYAGGMGPGSS